MNALRIERHSKKYKLMKTLFWKSIRRWIYGDATFASIVFYLHYLCYIKRGWYV